ncbi:MAG: hypothetical protein AB7E55_22075 [Pigmentiphaga sp.]
MNNGAAVGPQGEGKESSSNFPAYPAYKDSGVEWLGEVPEHWTVIAIKWLSPVFRGASPRPIDDPIYFDDEGEFGWVRIADVTASPDGYLYETTQKLSALGSSLSVKLDPGELFLSIAGSVGKPCITKIKACIHDGFVYFPWLSIDQRLLYRIFESGLCFGGLGKMGTQLNLNTDTVGGICIAVPPAPELSKALAFLDHETARIDALIEEQQRLIELLKEKRRGIVLSALSDTSLPLVRIGHAVDVISRPVKQREDESYTPIGLFNRDRGLFHKEPREMQDMGDSDFFWIKSGDLIISGQFAWEGAVAMAGESEEGLVVSHRYPVLRGKHGVANTEYLYAILTTKHGDFLLNESSRGAAGRNRPLNLAALLKEKIRIPSKEIQEQVSNLVQNEAKVLTECRQQISLLQERRSALISAAVTGKIDVRGWQPPASTQAPKLEVEEAN